MKLALSGYGKMGRAIEAIAQQRGHTIELVIDNETDWAAKGGLLQGCDVMMEFSTPATAVDNIRRAFGAGVAVVAGTTGWNAPDLMEQCRHGGGRLFRDSNFSIGLNIMRKVGIYLASVMNAHGEYDICISETHHCHKKDAPSGTAITLAEDVVSHLDRKTHWQAFEPKGERPPESLQVFSLRQGEVVGEHTVVYDCGLDSIALTHKAADRKVFAYGAVLAAEFVQQCQPGVYSMTDLLG